IRRRWRHSLPPVGDRVYNALATLAKQGLNGPHFRVLRPENPNTISHFALSFQLGPNRPPQPLTISSQRLQRRVIPLGTPSPRPTQPPSRRPKERQACPARGVPGGSRGRARAREPRR